MFGRRTQADVTKINDWSKTPLDLAKNAGHTVVVDFLMKHDVKASARALIAIQQRKILEEKPTAVNIVNQDPSPNETSIRLGKLQLVS